MIYLARPKNVDRESIKTERVSIALTPPVYNGVLSLAQIQGVSVNELVGELIERVVKQNAAVIADFNAARDKAAETVNLNVGN